MLGEKDFSSIEKSRIINLIPAESMCNRILNGIRARLKKIYASTKLALSALPRFSLTHSCCPFSTRNIASLKIVG
jgi:hypothetical protein